MYTWWSERDFKDASKVTTDKDIDEALQEVRSVMPEWYVTERIERTKSFWRKEIINIRYSVYQRTQPFNEEVRYQLSAVDKQTVLNLLYGLYMGYKKAEKQLKTK